MAEAPAAPAVAPAQPENVENWPPTLELERWLMNTAKDGDQASIFLRRMLQMNPAYGAYLASDSDLARIVQLFAKRVRARVMAAENPVKPATLYEPLCELTWRVVGHVLHAILELENTALPMPKEPLGQVKMLLQTNIELSKKLNSMRRAYLRELSEHRDKQRTISQTAERALDNLREYPVMFFEPLEFVLDDATKDFVRNVVEERVKLEQSSPPIQSKAMGTFVEEVERRERTEEDRDDAELNKAISETRQLRGQLEREKELRKLSQEEAVRLREQVSALAEGSPMAGSNGDPGAAESEEVRALKERLAEQTEALQELGVDSPGSEGHPGSRSGRSGEKLKACQAELEEANLRIKDLEEELEKFGHALPGGSSSPHAGSGSAGGQDGFQAAGKKGKAKGAPGAQGAASADAGSLDDQDFFVDKALPIEEQLEKHLNIEKELREANRELQKALDAERKSRSLTTNGGPEIVDTKNMSKQDKDVAAQIKKATEMYEKKLKAQAQEIERLKGGETEGGGGGGGGAAGATEAGEPAKVKKVIRTYDSSGGDDGEVKAKLSAMEEEKEEMDHENAKLKQQVAILIDKLRQIGGDQAVKEVAMQIKLTPAPMKKRKKKKAFERLYEDAQRRIISIRMRQDKLQEEQEQMIRDAMKRIRNTRSLRVMNAIGHLQKAAAASNARFTDAMSKFNDENPPEPGARAEGAEGAEEYSEGYSNSRPGTTGTGMGIGASRSWSPAPLGKIDYRDPVAAEKEVRRLRYENRSLVDELRALREELAEVPLSLVGRSLLGTRSRSGTMDTMDSDGSRSPSRSFSRSASPSKGGLTYANTAPLGTHGLSPAVRHLTAVNTPTQQSRQEIIRRMQGDALPTVERSSVGLNAVPPQINRSQSQMLPATAPPGRRSPSPPGAYAQLSADPPWRRPITGDARLDNAHIEHRPLRANPQAERPTQPRGKLSQQGSSAIRRSNSPPAVAARELLSSVEPTGQISRPVSTWKSKAGTPTGSIELGPDLSSGSSLEFPAPPGRQPGGNPMPPPPMSANRASRKEVQIATASRVAPVARSSLTPLNARAGSNSPERDSYLQADGRKLMTRSASNFFSERQMVNDSRAVTAPHVRPSPQKDPRTLAAEYAPVKPLPNSMCVTALRSQESLSNLSTQPPLSGVSLQPPVC
eukprot:TRINITY_DN19676_c0_g1_i1.p1 TRINITY_DN19676_c0_g1~~TRINITY_DN19676_c0_g1_i1.p1  ORF type:complete len:1163 (+),score=275.96 TRINITY_DN19676_c0_g1_i1:41-3529(+)